MDYDKIIIGAGIYGLYSALHCARHGQKIIVLECDLVAFSRATYANQARVHQGYHYPRALSTAVKSAGYFARFNRDFNFCINRNFDKIYATAAELSWTDRRQFKDFCQAAAIQCEELCPEQFFNKGMCDGVFRVREYAYDAIILRDFFLEQLGAYPNVQIEYGITLKTIEQLQNIYKVSLSNGRTYTAPYLLNASYASTNQVTQMLHFPLLKIKYELCEIIICDVNEQLRQYGITVMDGPFFSIMPFGHTGLHSLTSVTFTPHSTSYAALPTFRCQNGRNEPNEQNGQSDSNDYCSPEHLGNCNTCAARPATAFSYMAGLARKYLRSEFQFTYHSSLFSIKPILLSSELDDSRPTVIRIHSSNPTFVSVLSGKINTIYDMDEALDR